MNRPRDKLETRFQDAGALPKPRIVGRIVRLLFGAMLLMGLYSMFTDGTALFSSTDAPASGAFWIYVAIIIYLTPYVVNIGFGKNWRRKPQVVLIVVAVVLVAVDVTGYGTWWAPPLGAFIWLWVVYISAHLGLSFVLSTILGTPGCEMRAIPHLKSLVTGRAPKEHYCPGPLDRLDKWEIGEAG